MVFEILVLRLQSKDYCLKIVVLRLWSFKITVVRFGLKVTVGRLRS